MTSLLSQVIGHAIPTQVVRRALETGRAHHAYLFEGPEGTGRELVARAFAQGLVCEARSGEQGLACGTCSACARVPSAGMPTHPDVVLVGKGLYEPGQIGRKTPETQDISIDQVRTVILARAAYGPHEGRARVIIVRRVEELSIGAANALLKTLEEPLPKTHFILLTQAPDMLLPTIRSRTLRVRFGKLASTDIEAIARAHTTHSAGLDEAKLQGTTHALFDEDSEARAQSAAFLKRAMQTLEARDFMDALDASSDAKKDRDGLETRLARFAADLAERGAREGEPHALQLAQQHHLVLQALVALDGNVAPQLALERMFSGMREIQSRVRRPG